MADKITAPTSSVGGQPAATAQPASQTPAAAPASAAPSSPAPVDVAADFSEKFGGTPGKGFDDQPQTGVPADGQSATATDPATAGHPGTGEAPAQPRTDKAGGQPASETLVDDVIAEFEKLAVPAENADATAPASSKQAETSSTEFDPLDTDEKIAKAIDPDGKAATDSERLNNAQSALGRQGKELGETRKKVRDFEQTLQNMARDFVFEDGKPPRLKGDAIMRLTQNTPPEEIQEALAQAGVKIVPLDYKGEQDQDSYDRDIDEIAKKLIPGDELTVEEKLEEIRGNARMNTRLLAMLSERSNAREKEKAQQQLLQEDQSLRTRQDYEKWFGEIQKLPYAKDIAPGVLHWNKEIPADQPLTGETRRKVLFALGQLNRVPKLLKERDAAVRKAIEQEYIRKLDGGSLPAGVAPTFVSGNVDDTDYDRQHAARAQKAQEELASSGLIA